MKLKKEMNEIMKDVQVGNDITNEILNCTVRKNQKQRFGKKRVAVLAMVAVLCFGSVTVVAKDKRGYWNNMIDTVKEFFKADDADKEMLAEQGYVGMDENASDTKSGVKVSLVQTIADKRGMIIYLRVQSEKSMLEGGSSFKDIDVSVNGKEMKSFVWGAIRMIGENEGLVEVKASHASEEIENYKNSNIEVTLNNIMGGSTQINPEGKILVNDTWKLEFQGNGCENSKIINTEQTFTSNGTETVIRQIELTRLTLTIHYDYREDTEEVSFIPMELVYKNGKRHEIPISGIIPGSVTADEEMQTCIFDKAIDIEEIEYVIIDGEKYKL